MCIAIYKPKGVEFPSKRVLRTCFENNPDGAGFMVADGETVRIDKGYMGFTSFWKALRKTREKLGDDKAYVLHFRISTQAGIRQDCTHPFPLSANMDDLRELKTTADIGIAHNGIIDLTSHYSYGYDYGYGYGSSKAIDYSDTMEFITDYLSLIIDCRKYFKKKQTLELIERLCGSRLAILDATGHCELLGKGWERDEGIWYSNDSYKARPVRVKSTTIISKTADVIDWEEWSRKQDPQDEWDYYLDNNGFYDFEPYYCPLYEMGDGSYCELCNHYGKCIDNWFEEEQEA